MQCCLYSFYQLQSLAPIHEGRRNECTADLHSIPISHRILIIRVRAGLDPSTLRLVGAYESIVYISCSGDSLARDLEQVSCMLLIVSCVLCHVATSRLIHVMIQYHSTPRSLNRTLLLVLDIYVLIFVFYEFCSCV